MLQRTHRCSCGPRLAGLLAVAAVLPAAWAQEAEPVRAGEPVVQRIVLEDDANRIEELRVRGQTRSIRITPKQSGMAAYDIVVPDPGRDPSQLHGNAGRRQWSLWTF